ncbi:hypothetical protein OF83DRAFT_503457 [Amylostereum chailletii]|nr:hypothetical protein OF83DRAFT_503457 [Amylostereum chailletii]
MRSALLISWRFSIAQRAVLRASTPMAFQIRNYVIDWFEERWPASTLPGAPDSPPIPQSGQAVFQARRGELPKVLKRAHYEFIRLPLFNVTVEANRSTIDGRSRRNSLRSSGCVVHSYLRGRRK